MSTEYPDLSGRGQPPAGASQEAARRETGRNRRISIEIFSDVACPWCYIGKRKLESALTVYAEDPGALPVDITYRSFELAPDTPEDFKGSEADFVTAHRGLDRAQVEPILRGITAAGAAVGLTLDFDALQHANTLKALQLLHYAKAHFRQAEVKEALLQAYFTDGGHIGRTPELAELAGRAGLDPVDVARSLESGEYLEAVRADQEEAGRLGITSVPFFVIDGRYGISGAQEPEAFLEVLRGLAPDRAGGHP
ncbi:DsbA family oxidoreductase [Arthrobacter frigidicola]|nr:DsbA family oxidoreductase [Arthrobacter frigidicola]